MPDQAQLLKTIDEAYASRARGDKAALDAYWAPEATFRLAGEASLLPTLPMMKRVEAKQATSALIDRFQFHDHERLHAVVDGNMAAVHWRVTVSADGREPVTTELYDLWNFDDQGKVTSLLQFADTALLTRLLS